MNSLDWRWIPIQARLPADGQTVAIKFVDGSDAVRYGIGWYNAKEQSWGGHCRTELVRWISCANGMGCAPRLSTTHLINARPQRNSEHVNDCG